MRIGSGRLLAIAVMTAISMGACATAVNDAATDVPITTGGEDAGGDPQDAGEDSASNVVTPVGEDAGDQSSSTVDSATTAPGNDSSTTTVPEASTDNPDTSTPIGQDAATTNPLGQTICPNETKYANEFSSEFGAGTGTPCTVGSDCAPTECCDLGLVVLGLCVPL
jgi:hypothetical protein